MSSLFILIFAGILFCWGYCFYAKRLENLFGVDTNRATPSYSKFDAVDYVPAKNWLVLFGHHFASIAGAGPIIGPVIAVVMWGWLPALLWVTIGTVFIGGVHDFGTLIISVKEDGSSVAEIAGRVISRRARIIFSSFVLLSLILVIAVFGYLCADTFVKEPKIVLPSLGLIPVAILVGFLLYNLKVKSGLVTVLGMTSLICLVIWGNFLPISANINIWLVVLFLYCYLASILPVNLLLQPRDYLSALLLFFGVGIGYLALLLSYPKITMPAFHKFNASEGWLWPTLFVTIACGAISGFHSLISSGTTSKQIANERHAKRIGYGAMVAEGLVAVLTIISIGVLFKKGEDFSKAFNTIKPIGLFGSGYGLITKNIFGGYGSFIAITILNAFILTTLDTATRISRYLTEELLNIKNRFFSTGLIVLVSAILAFSGKWNKIWPAFGASNQLVAALALLVVACWLAAKNKSIRIVFWPVCFMLITTVAALLYQAVKYFRSKDITLFIIVVVLIMLSVIMLREVFSKILLRRKTD